MKYTLAITILLVCLFTIFSSSYSLSCYRCYSNAGHSRPDCETISSDQDKYLSECTEDEPNCLTAVREAADGKLTVRKCAGQKIINACKSLNSPNAKCQLCDTDGCNNSNIDLHF